MEDIGMIQGEQRDIDQVCINTIRALVMAAAHAQLARTPG
jgi:hypothetical protein